MAHLDGITFSTGGAGLDRAAHLRPQAAALAARPGARMLPFREGRPLADVTGPTVRLGWRPVEAQAAEAIFLGLAGGGAPRFATEAPEGEPPEGYKFIDLRSIAGELAADEATAAATAKGILGWHATHGFCARCGAPSGVEDGGWRRRCPACGGMHFPRIDPVVIMLIVHGDDVLIGRQPVWPPGLHSLLAGYMEPGETIEDAVRREVLEESAIRVGRVSYLACQPWPFPSSLMLGCAGEALTREITVDETELESARWVPRAEMATILAGGHPDIAPPRIDAIARSILMAWVAGDLGTF